MVQAVGLPTGWYMLQTSSGLRTVPLGSSLALEVEEVRVYQHREQRNPNPRGGFLTRKKIEQNYSRSYSKRSYTEPDQRPPRLEDHNLDPAGSQKPPERRTDGHRCRAA